MRDDDHDGVKGKTNQMDEVSEKGSILPGASGRRGCEGSFTRKGRAKNGG